MNGQACGVSTRANVGAGGGCHNTASGEIMRILKTDKGSCGLIIRRIDFQHRFDLVPCQMPRTVDASHGAYRYPRNQCGRANLVVENMAALFGNDFLSGPSVHLDRNLVSHAARRNPESSLSFKNLRGSLLQVVYGWVVAKDIVPDLGRSHSGSHFSGRLSNCVTSEVDHFVAFCVTAV